MSLIEHLHKDNWQDTLRGTFEYALEVLKEDRFRHVGSATDDMISWLACGGVKRVKHHLNNQMKMLRFPEDRQTAIIEFVEQLTREHRSQLLELTAKNILPSTQEEWLEACGFAEGQFEDILSRIIAGERPFEDWMHEHGHTDEDIAEIYHEIDQWLLEKGLISPSPYDPSLN